MFRFLIFTLIVPMLAACDDGAPKINTGSIAPGFSTVYMDGKPMRFPDDVRGKPVIIRFWADWCSSCEGELKDIEKIYRRRRTDGLVVLAVNAGQEQERVSAFIRRIGISYPSLLDKDAAIARQYGVTGLPTTFYVGADGVILSKVVGAADEAVFDKLAEELLHGKR